jgi:hypothetical protein
LQESVYKQGINFPKDPLRPSADIIASLVGMVSKDYNGGNGYEWVREQ